jgi:hypothetical protein
LAYNTATHSIQAREFIYAGSPTAFYEENFPSEYAVTDCAIGTTSLVTATSMYLYEGDTITSIGVCVAGTAGATVTHRLVGIYSGNTTAPAQLAVSADSTTATLAANTIFTQALTSPFVVPSSGQYWICIQPSHGGTQPSLLGRASGLNVTATAAINAQLAGSRTLGICATATGGSSTMPATLAATMTQLSVQPWMFLI